MGPGPLTSLRAGDCNRQIVIEKNTPTRDAFGAEVPNWSTFATVWASIEPLRGREFFDALAQRAEIWGQIRFWYIDGVTTGMRVLWGSKLYDIRSVACPDERRRELLLTVRELT